MKFKNIVGIFFLIASIAAFTVIFASCIGTHKMRLIGVWTALFIMGIFASGFFMDIPYLINIIAGALAELFIIINAVILLATEYMWVGLKFTVTIVIAAVVFLIWYAVIDRFYYGENETAIWLTPCFCVLAALCWYFIEKSYLNGSWLHFILAVAVYAVGVCSGKHGLLSVTYIVTCILLSLYFLGTLPLIFVSVISAVVFAALFIIDVLYGYDICKFSDELWNKIKKR